VAAIDASKQLVDERLVLRKPLDGVYEHVGVEVDDLASERVYAWHASRSRRMC
jgi:hypothetical protein